MTRNAAITPWATSNEDVRAGARPLLRAVRLHPFARTLVRFVAADDAAGRGTHQAVMARVVTRHTAYDCTFDTAFGTCRRG
jgi:hypothetical protein